MKVTIAFCFALIIFLFVDRAAAKDNDLVKANYYYSHFKFRDAIIYYEKIADEKNDPVIYAELADCYRYINDFPNAKKTYLKAVELPDCSDTVKLHFGQVLMGNKEYGEALKYFKIYQTDFPTEKRVNNLITSCLTADSVLKSVPKGEISFLNLNTNNSEYAPALWRNKLVFTADYEINLDKKSNKIIQRPSNLYTITCEKDGVCSTDMKKILLPNEDNKTQVGPATFSPDGKSMYFSRTKNDDDYFKKETVKSRGVVVPLEIMIASDFDTSSNRFSKVVPFIFNSKKYSVSQPTISPDGNMIVFTSDMPDGIGGSDLYYCTKNTDDEWSKPINLGDVVNTEGEELFPFLADNETLYFSSNGLIGLGGLDIYYSKWDEKAKSFSTPVNVGIPINSPYDDISLALFPDGRSSYFSSNRPAFKKGDNIYYFNKAHAFVKINVYDSVTNNPLNNMRMSIQTAGEKRDIAVDKDGKFMTYFYPDLNNKIVINKKGYAPKIIQLSGAGVAMNDTISQNVLLENLTDGPKIGEAPKPKEPELPKYEPDALARDSVYYQKQSLFLMSVVDSQTKKPLKGVMVTLNSEKDNRILQVTESGKLFTQLYPEILYTFSLSKVGYNDKSITLKTIFAQAETDTFRENVRLSRIKKGKKELVAKTKKHNKPDEQQDDENLAVVKNGKHPKKPHHSKSEKAEMPSNLKIGGLYQLKGYYFEVAKYDMIAEENYLVDSLVMMLNEHPTMKIQINGHADCRGPADYNMKLSIKRAETVVKYMIKQGIDPKRLKFKGYGITKPKVKCPVCKECTEEQHVQNRGIEYEVLHM